MTDRPDQPDPQHVASIIAEAERQGSEALANGNFGDATRVFEQLLSIQPDNKVALFAEGIMALDRGDLARAEHYLRNATRAAPDWAPPFVQLGRLLLDQGRLSRAERALEKAVELDPADTAVRFLFAKALMQAQKMQAFERELRAICEMDPEHGDAHNDLGCLLAGRGEIDAAAGLLRRAVDSDADRTAFANNYANVMLLKSDLDAARDGFSRVLAIEADNIDALIGLATTERRGGDLQQALLRAEQACSLNPDHPGAVNLVGIIYRELGNYEEAEDRFNAALQSQPDDASAHANLGMLRLLQGDWKTGFDHYEARRSDPANRSPWGGVNVPEWTGDALNGRNILVLSEQGFGDSLQFIRFLPKLAETAGTVHLAVQPELAPLVDGFSDAVRLIKTDVPIDKIDLQCPLLSLPRLLGITGPDQIDGAPYLRAPAPTGALKKVLGGLAGFKVGINWQGNPGHKEDFKRSVAAAALAPLLGVPGASFVNLNIGVQDVPAGIVDPSADIQNFADSAALLSGLDLVISVDTATVHLAGALGVPCWAMIPFVPDWRWGLGGEATPWYTSVTLYRQPARGDWDSVIARLADDLKAAAA